MSHNSKKRPPGTSLGICKCHLIHFAGSPPQVNVLLFSHVCHWRSNSQWLNCPNNSDLCIPTWLPHTYTDPIFVAFIEIALKLLPLPSGSPFIPTLPPPHFTLLHFTAVKAYLPVKWSSDIEYSSWAQGYDGTAYFSLCQPFSYWEWQKKARDTGAVIH